MGNEMSIRECQCDIDFLFHEAMPAVRKNLAIDIDVALPSLRSEEMARIEHLRVCTDENGASRVDIFQCSKSEARASPETLRCQDENNYDQEPRLFSWTPKTRLRDYEILNPFTKNAVCIERWAGIGKIIVEVAAIDITMYYQSSDRGFRLVANRWDHTYDSRCSLKRDLALGYDVLYLAGEGMRPHYFCEPQDDCDFQTHSVPFQIVKTPEVALRRSIRCKKTRVAA